MTDLESYRQQLVDDHGMRELKGYDPQAKPPYFYQYADDEVIYVHTRFTGKANAIVGIFSPKGEFIYGGQVTTTH
ncbi:MAG: hypothetical protein ACE5K1_09335 [Acidiferrobacterales bacterium]